MASKPKTQPKTNRRLELIEARKEIDALEHLLAESERAVAIYCRAADLARREVEEQRRRRLAIEEEMNFVNQPKARRKPRRKPRRRT